LRGRRHQLELNHNAAGARAAFLRVAGVVAQATGIAFGDIVIPDRPGRPNRRLRSPAGFARHLAIYLTVTGANVRQGPLGRVSGRPRRSVLRSCHMIEDMRDDPSIDELVTRLEAML